MKPEDIKGIVGDSPAIQAAIDKIRIVAKSRSTVVLRGETGTGKEVFATALHKLSPRHAKAFVKLNCAALSGDVLESELSATSAALSLARRICDRAVSNWPTAARCFSTK